MFPFPLGFGGLLDEKMTRISLFPCLFVCFHTRSPGAGIIGSLGESQGGLDFEQLYEIL